MTIECQCSQKYTTRNLSCSDRKEGCLVVHTDRSSYSCPKCGRENSPNLSAGVSLEIGEGVVNPKIRTLR